MNQIRVYAQKVEKGKGPTKKVSKWETFVPKIASIEEGTSSKG
jgi:hypothetical protein